MHKPCIFFLTLLPTYYIIGQMIKNEPDKHYHQLLTKRNRLIARLPACAHLLRGTIVSRGNICGNPHCRCKRKPNPQPHGPYQYLSHRGRTKTQMIFLNKKKLRYTQQGIKEYNQLIDLLYQISELNFKLLRYHYHRIGHDF